MELQQKNYQSVCDIFKFTESEELNPCHKGIADKVLFKSVGNNSISFEDTVTIKNYLIYEVFSSLILDSYKAPFCCPIP